MTSSSFRALFALLNLLAVAQAAPSRSDKHTPHVQWTKRQEPQDQEILFTETRTVMFSETVTETFTETYYTASGSGLSGSGTSTDSTRTATSAFQPPTQVVHVQGTVPSQDPSAQDVYFLPLGSDASTVPATWTSVNPTRFDSASSAPTPTDPTATESSFDGDDGPAFAAQTPVVKGPLLSAYYPDWAASVLPPEKIDMSRLDWIDFAFGVLNQDCSIGWDDPSSSPGILNRVVSAAHAKGTKVKLSIGGWDGSRYFSACSMSNARSTFVNNVVNVYNQYHLDGVDIDWEYPGQQGAGSNGVSPQDSANFLSTLRLLRTRLPSGARITAAVTDFPFTGPNGNPLTDVSNFAAVLDWVNIMNYDVFGSSSTPGPNAPLDNGCNDSSQPQYNARSAIKAWSDAKFPASRLMLGVPFYGYLNPSDATQIQHKKRSFLRRRQDSQNGTTASFNEDDSYVPTSFLPLEAPPAPAPVQSSVAGDDDSSIPTSFLPLDAPPIPAPVPSSVTNNDDDSSSIPTSFLPFDAPPAPASVAGNITGTVSNITSAGPAGSKAAQAAAGTVVLQSGDGITTGGQIQFVSIVQQGALTPVRAMSGSQMASTTTFMGSGGFTRFWDSCSSTPFLSSPYSNQVVTYDDTQSLGLKGSFAKKSGILGTAVWDLSGDTAQWDLTDALRRGLGKA